MKKPRILIVDDDAAAHKRYEQALSALDSPEFCLAKCGKAALEKLASESFDLMIVRVDPAAAKGFELLRSARRIDAELPLVVVTDKPTVDSATASLRLGASDYLSQPIDPEVLAKSVDRLLSGRRLEAEYELLRRQVERPYGFDDMIGGSPAMRKVFDTIEQVAHSDVDVLVVGETGTGKELVARSFHRRSRRAKGPFVPVDCGAIPENLLESEFYGHEKGSFTGAEGAVSACSNSPTRARSFSTSWANCRCSCRRSCCARCKSARFAAWADARKSTSTCGSWPPRPATSTR